MNEQNQIVDENTTVICPWCLNVTEFIPSEEVQHCLICRRIFTEEDMDYDQQEED
jgi:hypothetical protein